MLVLVAGARLAGIPQELDDGVLARAGQPRNGAHGHTLDHHAEDAHAGFGRELVHTADIMTHIA